MNSPGQPYQAAHEVGKIYDAITDSKVLADFFLTSLLKFVPSRGACLFLSTQNKTLLLENTVPPESAVPEDLAAAAKEVFEEGKPRIAGTRMYLPLIARNNAIGIAVLLRDEGVPVFKPQALEISFDLASYCAGALKNILLFEENLKMERLAAVGQAMGMVIHEIKNIMQLARFSDEMTRMGIKEKNEKFLEKGL